MRVLTVEQMRRFDRWAIEELGVTELVLQENAALGVVDAIGARFPAAEDVLVVCGPGNNGADGLAVARQLATRGYRCAVRLAASRSRLSASAAAQLRVVERLGLPVREISDEELSPPTACDLVVDALFGTGLSRPLEGRFAALVRAISSRAAPVVSVDLPSGLDAGRAVPIGPHVEADLTVTFARPKIAHVLDPAARACGELVVADLGVPWVDLESEEPICRWLRADELASWLLPRAPESHKGDFGRLLVVAGSAGMSGAAVLAARGAVRAGAGLVTLAVPEAIRAECHVGCPEAMTVAVPAGSGERETAEALLAEAAKPDAVAIGPGLGSDDAVRGAVREVVARCAAPLVLDADGINAFSGRADELLRRRGELVLTPHPGELARLLGIGAEEVQADRLRVARATADRTGAVVVLKGHQTLVARPGGEVAINPTGNAGMATGGTGDVLTGVLGALLAQGYETSAAAELAVFVHGLAGDRAAERFGERTLAASDLVDELRGAFWELERDPA